MNDKLAVIAIGGKQHLVAAGSKISVNQLELKEGDKMDTDVLLVTDGQESTVGMPLVANAKVSLKVLGHSKSEKVEVAKFKAKSRYRRKVGHRQPITTLEVVAIKA